LVLGLKAQQASKIARTWYLITGANQHASPLKILETSGVSLCLGSARLGTTCEHAPWIAPLDCGPAMAPKASDRGAPVEVTLQPLAAAPAAAGADEQLPPVPQRWQDALRNMAELQGLVGQILEQVDTALYLDEEEYQKAVPAQQYALAIKVTLTSSAAGPLGLAAGP
jgi:hypothetical protein